MKNKIILALTLTALMTSFVACSTTKEPTADNNMNGNNTTDNTANNGTNTVNMDFGKTYNEILGVYGTEDMWPNNTVLDKQMLLDTYGIDEADLETWHSTMPMMNVQVDEFFMAKVKPGKMDAVETKLKERAKALDTQWSTYLPDKYEIVKNHKIVKQGDHIFFVVSEHADEAVKIFNSKF